jgi:putative membrane protein
MIWQVATTAAVGASGGALALLQAAPALAQPERYYGPGMMWDGGWLHMFFGFLMMLLFFGVLVLLVVLGVRWLGGGEHSPFRHGPGGSQRTALEILKERLARGEIDVAEFEERRRALGE